MLENAMVVDWYWGELEYGVPLRQSRYSTQEYEYVRPGSAAGSEKDKAMTASTAHSSASGSAAAGNGK